MPHTLEDLPIVEHAGRMGRRPEAESPVAAAYQARGVGARRLLDSVSLGMGMRLARMLQENVFPTGAELRDLDAMDAAGPSYSMYFDCTVYDYAATCEEACFGFAPHHMDPFYCATCDEQAADPTNNPSWNWHFVGTRGSIQYMDREPDVCNGKDAWKWTIKGSCGSCAQSAVFRCHDGYKKYPDSAYWDPTICQGIVSCDGTLTTC